MDSWLKSSAWMSVQERIDQHIERTRTAPSPENVFDWTCEAIDTALSRQTGVGRAIGSLTDG